MTSSSALGDPLGDCIGEAFGDVRADRPTDATAVCTGTSMEPVGAVDLHVAGMRWHFVRAGRGPRLLLLHGAGSTSGSWTRLIARLGGHFEILAPDLPGHGRSGTLPGGRAGLEDFATALGQLTGALSAPPQLVVGHSAGAAIAARMALERPGTAVIAINGALRPLAPWTAAAFVPLARLAAATPGLSRLIAAMVVGDPRSVRRLLDSTGSRIDPGMESHYGHLMRSPAHIAGTLRMFAHWSLRALTPALPRLGPRLTLIVGAQDRTVDPRDAPWVARQVPGSTVSMLAGLGHLAQEEAPERIAQIIRDVAQGLGLLADASPPASLQR